MHFDHYRLLTRQKILNLEIRKKDIIKDTAIMIRRADCILRLTSIL